MSLAIDRALAQRYHPSKTVPRSLARLTANTTDSERYQGISPHDSDPILERDRGSTGWRWPQPLLDLEAAHGTRFDALATQLLQMRREQGLRVVLVTSCQRAEGRTTLVLATARALVKQRVRVVVLDGDLTSPTLARTLGLTGPWSLEDVLDSRCVLEEAAHHCPNSGLTIFALRGGLVSPRQVLGSAAWSCLMARLRRESDLILIDGSPLFAGLNAAVLHNSVDGAIVVRHRGRTGERGLLRANEVLQAAGVPILGVADTFA